MCTSRRLPISGTILSLLFLFPHFGFSQVTSPVDYFGFQVGADFKLLSYEQAIGYLERLATESDRIEVFDMGPTGYERRMKYAVISSEQNMSRLDGYKEISRRLSLARDVSRAEAEKLAEEGRAIVWIDGGIHREEVVGAQMIPGIAYKVITGEDRRTRRIRDNVILVLAFANPDGMTIVTDWYMKYVGTKYESSPLPWRYLKLGGTNRDAFISNLPETRNMNRAMETEWYPVIYHNQHQTGPFPARIFIPPEGEPTNANVHPLVIRAKNLIGAAMGQALDEVDLPGAISRSAYDTWFPGYATQAPEGHNIPGILTETQSNRTEINRLGRATPHYYTVKDFPEEFQEPLKGIFYPSPWRAGWWRLSDQVQYNTIASMGELDAVAKYRYELLFNKWKMATDIIERFESEPPYGWIVPAAQSNAGAVALAIDRLLVQGLEVHVADSAFEHDGISYPKGSYLLLTSQPFGLYLKNLFEIQEHPDLRKHSALWQALPRLVKYDAEPMRPYDNVGWTLPILMGFESHEISSPLDVETTRVMEPSPVEGGIEGSGPQYVFSCSDNNSFKALNRILKGGGKVTRALEEFTLGGATYPKGTFLADGAAYGRDKLAEVARTTPMAMRGGNVRVRSKLLTQGRVGVYKSWVRSDDAAWMLWLFERHEFPFHLLTNNEVKAGNLRDRFDFVVLSDQSAASIVDGYEEGTMPPEYVGGITMDGVENLKSFVEAGGTLLCNKSSADLVIQHFDAGVKNLLKDVSAKDFNCPGSIVRMHYDTDHPVALGMPEDGIAFFSGAAMRDEFLGGYVFEIASRAGEEENESDEPMPRIVANFPEESLLVSGWFIGEKKVRGQATAVEIPIGKGKVVLFGFNVVNRGQSHATFRLLLNSLYLLR